MDTADPITLLQLTKLCFILFTVCFSLTFFSLLGTIATFKTCFILLPYSTILSFIFLVAGVVLQFEDDKGNLYHTNSEYGIRPSSTLVGAFYPYCDGIGWLLAIPNIVKKNCTIEIDAKKAYDYISYHVTEYIPSEWYTKTITAPEDFFEEGNEWDSVSVYMRGGTYSMRVGTQSPGPHWVLVGTWVRIGYTNEYSLSFFPNAHDFGYPLNAEYNPEVMMAVGAALFSNDSPYMYESNAVNLPNGGVWEGF